MKHSIKIKDLAKVSFIKYEKPDGRTIPMLSCFNEKNEWEMWLPSQNNDLVRIMDGQPIEAMYFAKTVVENNDGYLEFFNLIFKHLSYSEITIFTSSIYDDLQNLAASTQKLDVLFQLWKKDSKKISGRYISTELEYIFNTCRSIFDLLQEIIQRLWRRFKYSNQEIKKKELPSSFAKMILVNDTPSSSQEISARYNIPSMLADFYHRQGKFFSWLRDYRDNISHSGKSFDFIFLTERGFAVSIEKPPFSELDIWNDRNTLPNKLGSIRSAVAYVIINTVNVLEDFTETIQSVTKLPPDIAPEYKVFMRGHHTQTLFESQDHIQIAAWFE